MSDYKAILDARVAAGELVLRAPGVYAFPKPAPVQTHIPAPEPGPVLRGAAPPERQAVNPHKAGICKRLGLKYKAPIIHKARGCEGRRHVPQPPRLHRSAATNARAASCLPPPSGPASTYAWCGRTTC